jgi:cell shape-determining protein MreC
MKNSYYRRRSPLLSSPSRVAAAVLAAIALILFVLRFAAPSAFFVAVSPFLSIGNVIPASVGSVFAGFGNAASLARDVDALTRANEALVNENFSLKARLADYGELVREEGSQGVMAGVIARPPLAPYDVLVVALPAGSAVSQGALVSGAGGVPVGTVESIAGGYAHIALLSMPERATEGWAGEERIPMTIIGKGAGAFKADIPRDAAVVPGDIVYVPGPGARPVGTVREVNADPSSPRARVTIEPMTNLFMLTSVLIESAP